MISLNHIPGEFNPADILSKHWAYSAVWDQLQAILFWRGDPADLLLGKDFNLEEEKGSDKVSLSPSESPDPKASTGEPGP